MLINGLPSVIMLVMDETVYTIPAFFARSVALRGDEPALGFIRDGEMQWRTWRQVADEVANLAAALCTAGIEPGDRIAQVSENRYEWVITDLAIHLAGAVHVPMHVTLSGEQIAQQIDDCGARLVFVSSAKLLATFADRIDSSVRVVLHDEQGEGREKTLLDEPAVAPSPQSPAPSPDALATILYTSGTTGQPRGVMLSQQNLATNAAAIADALGGGAGHTRLGILPLSHIFARTCDMYTWLYCGSKLVLAEGRETLARDLGLARPTILNAVPYLYQKMADQIRAGGSGDESAALQNYFGGRVQILNSGGAALSPETEAWYAECGLRILPGYGLTEASPVISACTPPAHRSGSVGPLMRDVEVRLADDGEILVRGPNVMLGYWRDEAATAEAIRDGWLHTGDLGELDADGFLFIRGRKKELIVLSTGKKVLPSRVESLLTVSPLIEQAAVFGDGQASLTALIVPTARVFARSEERGSSNETIAAEIHRCLKSAAHEEQVRRFVLLDRPFSIERGELTPKMSLCRKVIAANFATEIKLM
ncbi:MAG: AMP-dependent synthetase/ligase [Pirellulales bacterium]